MSASDDQRQPVESRRRFPRRPTLKSGRIHLGPGHALSCLVLNVSDGGAKLQTDSVDACPQRFAIEIGTEKPRPCRVAWRAGKTMGVEFAAEEELAAAAPAPTGDPNAAEPRERRAWKRTLMLRGARIVFNAGFTSMRCNVLDLSVGGAKVQPIDPISCPDKFELRIDDGPTHKCEVVRKHRGTLGVRFSDVPHLAHKP